MISTAENVVCTGNRENKDLKTVWLEDRVYEEKK